MNDVKDSAEFYRNLWAGAEARLAESQAEVARLRAALERLTRSFPTDRDMERAGWDGHEVDEACDAYEAARAALEPTR